MSLKIVYLAAVSVVAIALTACGNAEYDEVWVDDSGVHQCGNEAGLETCDVDTDTLLLQTDSELEKEAQQKEAQLESQSEEFVKEQKEASERQSKAVEKID
jgi:hypothetical protein